MKRFVASVFVAVLFSTASAVAQGWASDDAQRDPPTGVASFNGRSTTAPECDVDVDKTQELREMVGRGATRRTVRHAFALTVRQDMPGKIGVYTATYHSPGLVIDIFRGLREVHATEGVPTNWRLPLRNLFEHSFIRSIEAGNTPAWKLLVYCRTDTEITRKLVYGLVFSDEERDRRFDGTFLVTTKLISSQTYDDSDPESPPEVTGPPPPPR
ncbi:MAG TPA: hypothetical protein VIE64_09045 [Solirubrobacterales bacterium]